MTGYSSGEVWMILGAVALGTILLRLSFIALLARVETIPEPVLRALGLVPAAVLAALVAPSLTHAEGSFDPTTIRFGAGVLASLVAWRTKNVLATITAGMITLWVLQALT